MTSNVSDKLVFLYVQIDDIVKDYIKYLDKHHLGSKRRPTRISRLSASEVATIIVFYHLSGFKNFQCYYQQLIEGEFKHYFPNAPSYKHFLSLLLKALPVLVLWALHSCHRAIRTGYYFIDSKQLPVCHLKRKYQHRVFKDIATMGKSSTGWFYGLKVHLVINHLGQIVNFAFTPANVADNNHRLLNYLLGNLSGKCVADKGYYTKLFEAFYNQGLQLILKPKKNSKTQLPALPSDIRVSKKRGVIESVNDILKTVCDIEHTQHRKAENALVHMIAAIIAYQSLETKPHVFIPGAINYLKAA